MDAEEKRKILKQIKGLVRDGAAKEAFSLLNTIAEPEDAFALQSRYARIYESLASDTLELQPIRLALLGSSTLEHFASVFGYWLAREGLNLDLYLASYDTIHQTILDPASELYAFDPEVVWLFTNHRDLKFSAEPGQSLESVNQVINDAVSELAVLWNAVRSRSSAHIIQNNADIPSERVFGNFEGSAPWGRANLLRRFNLDLPATMPPGSTVFDLDYLSSLYGKHKWYDHRFWFHSKHAFSLDACGFAAFHAARLVGSIKGKAKKCIVLDLDNTLWGGVIGDDGLEGIRLGTGAEAEAFVAFQHYLKALSNRGILLAVCSKNEEANAKEPFLQHPEMVLTLDDISVFKANWDNKPDNIREIAGILNIGLDSLVFVDDNPAEREHVRSALPMVTVPELPEDPAEYIPAIDKLRLFEAVSFSEEDKVRGRMYKDNVVRKTFQKQFSDLSEYLKGLDMEATVGAPDSFHLPRMAQLINKSNQFHLTGTRYSESEILALHEDADHLIRYFKLKDKFGDNGLISVLILKRDEDVIAIDTWVMSCRVLSRGMEEFICREILSIARDHGCRCIVGRYVPSKKNKLVANLYERLQFKKTLECEDGACHWEFVLGECDPDYEIYIRRATTENQETVDNG